MTAVRWAQFPAEAVLEGGGEPWHDVLVQVVDSPARVCVGAAVDGRPVVVFAADIVGDAELRPSTSPRYDSTSTIPTTVGVLTVTRGRGCGCQSPLRYANLLEASG